MKDIIERMKEFDALPEKIVINNISRINDSFYILEKNYEEIIDVFNNYEDPRIFIPLWSVKRRNDIDALLKEISRLFHNYLSAAATLVDHYRVMKTSKYK